MAIQPRSALKVVTDPIEADDDDFGMLDDYATDPHEVTEGGYDMFDDGEEDDEEEIELPENNEPISLDNAIAEAQYLIDEATDFLESEFQTPWADAERYYNGETDLPEVKGRSNVTATEVRDAIRGILPSVMRIFLQSDQIVEFIPPNIASGPLADMQTVYVNQLFWKNDGYRVLYDAVQSALVKKNGIIKSWFYEECVPEYVTIAGATDEQLDYLEAQKDIKILEIEETTEVAGISAPNMDVASDYATMTYRVQFAVMQKKGKIEAKFVPLWEFFIDEKATTVDDARVIGQRRDMHVGDIQAMGIFYDDWESLGSLDVETYEFTEESETRRGYVIDDNDRSIDPMLRKVLLTEAYIKFDLDGLGVPQIYRFWMGGQNYTYLDHERVDSIPYSNFQIDPISGAFFGRSIYDIVKEDQDTLTSLLRATCDNAHISNNKRLAVHETMVNMDDVLQPTLGYPIRVRAPGMIQEIGVTSSVGAMLPLLTALKEQADNKVGVTAAAMGLDPDALQSTDKAAVQNTIQLALSQIELMTRNLAETGMRPLCKNLMLLSVAHLDKNQTLQVGQELKPINQETFDLAMGLRATVGLGTASFDMKLAGLSQVLEKQLMITERFGMENPIVRPEQIYNTIADMTYMAGLTNVSRYFNQVTPDMAKVLDEQAQKMAQGKAPPDPAQGLVEAEKIKTQGSLQEKQIDAKIETEKNATDVKIELLKTLMNDDQVRDKMAQDLAVTQAEQTGTAVNEHLLRMEQSKDRKDEQMRAAGQAGAVAPRSANTGTS